VDAEIGLQRRRGITKQIAGEIVEKSADGDQADHPPAQAPQPADQWQTDFPLCGRYPNTPLPGMCDSDLTMHRSLLADCRPTFRDLESLHEKTSAARARDTGLLRLDGIREPERGGPGCRSRRQDDTRRKSRPAAERGARDSAPRHPGLPLVDGIAARRLGSRADDQL